MAVCEGNNACLLPQIFLILDLPTKLKIPAFNMRRFILAVRDRMLDQPYHNFFHICDVTQTLYVLVKQSGLLYTLEDLDIFALLVAGMSHDLEHPGERAAEFLVTTCP